MAMRGIYCLILLAYAVNGFIMPRAAVMTTPRELNHHFNMHTPREGDHPLLPRLTTHPNTFSMNSRVSICMNKRSAKLPRRALAIQSVASNSIPESSDTPTGSSPIDRLIESLTMLFPLWVFSFSILGWCKPSLFLNFAPLITPSLAMVMFSMGLTLTLDDFKAVLRNWRWVFVGFIAQYSIMPSLSWFFANIVFQLPLDLAIGLMLVGCSPGGTASNLVTLIAKADVALSVLMTIASTIAAIVVTPLLISFLVNSTTSSVAASTLAATRMIKLSDLINSVMSVVLLPVISGLGFNYAFPKISSKIANKFAPILSVVLVAMICGTVTASAAANRAVSSTILSGSMMFKLIGAVVSLHGFGKYDVFVV
jgi:bile acid:Na+ symporter, BASS family